MGLVENVLKKIVLQDAIITKKEKLSKSVYKIRLESQSINKTEFRPGYFLRLGIGIGNDDLSFKDKIRSYSVWDIDKTKGYLDLAIATESKGVGAKWVTECKEGDVIYFKWKKGNFLLDKTANSYLMIGDLSALSHLYIFNRNLPSNKQVESLIYNSSINDLFPDIDGTNPFKFYEIQNNPYEEIVNKLQYIIPKLKGKKMVYIAGDSRVCLGLNRFFRKELNWDVKQIKTKPFWHPDKKGLE